MSGNQELKLTTHTWKLEKKCVCQKVFYGPSLEADYNRRPTGLHEETCHRLELKLETLELHELNCHGSARHRLGLKLDMLEPKTRT
mmetsp:Transcript_4068/g.6422  ORF Transcript_4068/g.6422 Transcript_4068/m.6422 type:complete len:86 (-) Transcript_4068:439-696(-)